MYDKTIWQNGQTPLSEDNLNHIENGIEEAHRGTHIYAEASSVNRCYTLFYTPPLENYNIGLIINFKADVENRETAFLDINELGPVPIVKNVNIALQKGDIKDGQIVTVIFDGEYFQLINPSAVLASLYKDKGDIVYASHAQHLENLPIGSEGQYLRVKSGLPAWEDPVPSTKTISGKYIGDGTKDRYICLGFTPRFLIVGPENSCGAAGIGIYSNPYNFYSNDKETSGLTKNNYLRPYIKSNGFVISHKRNRGSINKKDINYYYFAIS
jgi:hypothetical protein